MTERQLLALEACQEAHESLAEDVGNLTDEDITPLDMHNNHPVVIQGLITRAHAQLLNLQVSSFLRTCFNTFKNRLLPNDLF